MPRHLGFSSVVGAVQQQLSAVEYRYQLLSQWDMETLKRYLLGRNTYSSAEIRLMEVEYKKYLALAMVNREGSLPIARKLDDFWHAHLIFTQDYAAMCAEVNEGRFVHHRPSILDGQPIDPGSSSRVLTMYRASFGHPPPNVWVLGDGICTDDGDCGCPQRH